MARITLRQLLDHAANHGYAVPAFNINNMEQGIAIMQAAASVDAPVIIQASRGARSYAGDIMLSHMIDALEKTYPDIPLCMHQDHGNDEATCASAIAHGFTSVMMDGSLKADAKTPADYDYNVRVTKNVVDMAHWVGASVEGELGVLGSLETGMGEKEDGHGFEGKLGHDQLLTDPDQAVEFVKATEVDALAGRQAHRGLRHPAGGCSGPGRSPLSGNRTSPAHPRENPEYPVSKSQLLERDHKKAQSIHRPIITTPMPRRASSEKPQPVM